MEESEAWGWEGRVGFYWKLRVGDGGKVEPI